MSTHAMPPGRRLRRRLDSEARRRGHPRPRHPRHRRRRTGRQRTVWPGVDQTGRPV
jgi:hypothetical protein